MSVLFYKQVKVTIGPSECDISELTDTSITCHTGEGFKTAVITNHGVSPGTSEELLINQMLCLDKFTIPVVICLLP